MKHDFFHFRLFARVEMGRVRIQAPSQEESDDLNLHMNTYKYTMDLLIQYTTDVKFVFMYIKLKSNKSMDQVGLKKKVVLLNQG